MFGGLRGMPPRGRGGGGAHEGEVWVFGDHADMEVGGSGGCVGMEAWKSWRSENYGGLEVMYVWR